MSTQTDQFLPNCREYTDFLWDNRQLFHESGFIITKDSCAQFAKYYREGVKKGTFKLLELPNQKEELAILFSGFKIVQGPWFNKKKIWFFSKNNFIFPTFCRQFMCFCALRICIKYYNYSLSLKYSLNKLWIQHLETF